MLKCTLRRTYIRLLGVAIVVLMMAVNPFRVNAGGPLGISGSATPILQFDCANFRFNLYSNPASGYAAVRIWINGPSGTPLFDSYIAGHPAYYAPIGSDPSGEVGGAVSFGPVPLGTKLYARVYRALTAAPGSWDGQNYYDTTTSCNNGVNLLSGWGLACNYFDFTGSAYPASGYVGVRIWIGQSNGTPLVDSFVAGYSAYYIHIDANGQFQATIPFPTQPVGTTLTGRLYRTTTPAFNSWDNGEYIERTWTCAALP